MKFSTLDYYKCINLFQIIFVPMDNFLINNFIIFVPVDNLLINDFMIFVPVDSLLINDFMIFVPMDSLLINNFIICFLCQRNKYSILFIPSRINIMIHCIFSIGICIM